MRSPHNGKDSVPTNDSFLVRRFGSRIDLNHYAVLNANPLHQPVRTKIIGPRLDYDVAGGFADNAAATIGIPDQSIVE
jgi:hypothetical protein